MKNVIYIVAFLLIILSSCSKKQKEGNKVVVKSFQAILDSANVSGTILVFDTEKNTYYSNDFKEAKSAYLPASTFKIPNSIIGLEEGILKNENSVFKWNGEQRFLDSWEKDLTLKEAFQKSCVPCYQELARKIGVKKMNNQLKKLKFGKMDVHKNTIDNFWLVGKSQISPMEQINFLRRFYNEQLPIKIATFKIVKSILKITSTNNYILSGKTGLAVTEKIEVGWFVGYVEIGKNIVYFATKIKNIKEIDRSKFIEVRKKVTDLALKKLKISSK